MLLVALFVVKVKEIVLLELLSCAEELGKGEATAALWAVDGHFCLIFN